MLLFGQLDLPAWLLLCIMSILLIYILGKRNRDAFRTLGLPGPSWSMPLLGEFPGLLRKGIYQFDLDLLNTYGKTVGFMEGTQASIMTKDIDFIKQVTIRQWYNFLNRKSSGNSEYGLRTMVSEVNDEQWKNIRSHMSPAFSTGKLRKMVGLINTSGKNLADNLEEIARNDETLDPKVFFGHYTMDVIASTAFGLEINSAKDRNNELVKHAKKFFNGSFWNPVLLAYLLAPCLVDPLVKIGFSFIPKDSSAYFIDVVKQAINGRKDPGYERVDFLQLMLNANTPNIEEPTSQLLTREEAESKDVQYQGTLQTDINKEPLTDEEIMGNAMVFLFAGYETTASMLQFLAYQLALNPKIQDRLIQEIDDVVGKDQPTYEMAGALKYLEMCIQETLRLYPIITRINRECKHSTTIDGITIPEGIVINISIIGAHRDPEIYLNPDEFDPERFSSEAKASRDPLAYLPFGAGPRHCIGMRLALLEAKIGMAMVLQKLKFVQCEGTKVPLQIAKEILLAPDKPIQLKLQLRP